MEKLFKSVVIIMVFVLAFSLFTACSSPSGASGSTAAAPSVAEEQAAVSPPASTQETTAATSNMTAPILIPRPEKLYTFGPNNEDPVWYDQVVLTPEEVEAARALNIRVALEGSNQSEWIQASNRGYKAAAALLNMKIVSETTCEVDPARQKENMENFAALGVDVVDSQAQEIEIAAPTYDPLVQQGVKLVFTSNVPKGYVAGKEYVSCVTDELYQSGVIAADILANALGGSGKIVTITSSAVSYVVNTRDQAFIETIKTKYPDIEILDNGGFEKMSDAGTAANGLLTRYPEAEGVYVSYATPAVDVLEVIRGLGRNEIKLVTLDLDVVCTLDMIKGGNVVGIGADMPYAIGYTQAMLAAYGMIGKEAPAFVVSPSFAVTAENIEEAWLQSMGQELPAELKQALK